jgi:HlyD family secretion protein
MLLPRRPPSDKHGNDAVKASKGGRQRVWVLRDDQPEAIEVHTGATDGILTQILEGPLEPGVEVLVDTLSGGR